MYAFQAGITDISWSTYSMWLTPKRITRRKKSCALLWKASKQWSNTRFVYSEHLQKLHSCEQNAVNNRGDFQIVWKFFLIQLCLTSYFQIITWLPFTVRARCWKQKELYPFPIAWVWSNCPRLNTRWARLEEATISTAQIRSSPGLASPFYTFYLFSSHSPQLVCFLLMTKILKYLYHTGQIIVSKVFVGNSLPILMGQPFDRNHYIGAVSVHRNADTKLRTAMSEGIWHLTVRGNIYFCHYLFSVVACLSVFHSERCCSSDTHSSFECGPRSRQWFVFDHELALPEYIIYFEYIPEVIKSSVFCNSTSPF